MFSSKHLLPDVARCDLDIRKGRNFAVNHQKQMQDHLRRKQITEWKKTYYSHIESHINWTNKTQINKPDQKLLRLFKRS